jgi:hypothetical protein
MMICAHEYGLKHSNLVGVETQEDMGNICVFIVCFKYKQKKQKIIIHKG